MPCPLCESRAFFEENLEDSFSLELVRISCALCGSYFVTGKALQSIGEQPKLASDYRDQILEANLSGGIPLVTSWGVVSHVARGPYGPM